MLLHELFALNLVTIESMQRNDSKITLYWLLLANELERPEMKVDLTTVKEFYVIILGSLLKQSTFISSSLMFVD